ncbi:MAG: SpoIIE family protein phosphatase [Bacteroidales bacterium]|nr:SpoIIE family protein phosphatase [Bacteroidales bacterium]
MKKTVYILFLVFQLICLSGYAVDNQDSLSLREELKGLEKLSDESMEEGDYEKLEGYVFRELEISYALKDSLLSAKFMFQLANVFANTLRSAEALTYFHKSLKICQKFNDSTFLGDIYSKLGAIYAETHVYDMALEYLKKYLEIAKSRGDSDAVVSAELTIAMVKGELYEEKNDTVSLLEALKKCEEVFPKLSRDGYDFMNFCINVPNMYIKGMEFSDEMRAKYFLEKADEIYCAGLPLTKQSQIFYIYMFQTKIALFCAKGNFAEAKRSLDAFKRDSETTNYIYVNAACTYYRAVKDYPAILKYTSELRKISNLNFSSDMCAKYERNQQQTNYENTIADYEKQARERDFIFKEESRRAAIQNRWLLGIAFFAGLIVLIVVFQFVGSSRVNKSLKKTNEDIRFRNAKLQELQDRILQQTEEIKSQNSVIEAQRNDLQQINEHLISSLKYAQRIQRAAVPSAEMMADIFPENLVYWQPRDIVSGDFYWAAQDSSRKYLITADCTGHGVPGALLSMLGISVINDTFSAINSQMTAAGILDILKDKFVESWSKGQGNIEDGIDMALIVVDKKTGQLQYAGAKRPLIMVRGNEITQYKPDKLCIGYNIRKEHKKFTNHVIETCEGDMFYAFSDGIPDQFGGDDGKTKFGQRVVEELLANISDLSMEVQTSAIKANVQNWMNYNGLKVSQLDDQLLLGVKI